MDLSKNQSSLPISFQSFCHGASLLIAVMSVLAAFMGLYYSNDGQMLRPYPSDCDAINMFALYGEDSILYCPITQIVSSTQFLPPCTNYVVDLLSQKPDIVSHQNVQSPTINFSFSGNKKASGGKNNLHTYWYFNLNHESVFTAYINYTVSDNPEISINGKKLSFTAGQPIVYNVDQDDSYKFQISGDSQTTGTIQFTLDEALYYDPQKQQAVPSCNNFQYDFGQDVCLSIYSLAKRNWNTKSAATCAGVVQYGYNGKWFSIILPSLIGLVGLVSLFNIAIYFICARQKRKRSSREAGHF